MEAVAIVARTVPGAVLLLAGISKLLHARWFAVRVADYKLIPPRFSWHAAVSIIAAEICLGGGLVVGVRSSLVTIGSVSLFGLFAVALSVSLLRNKSHECGCGRSGDRVSWRGVYRNVAMITLVLLASNQSVLGGSMSIVLLFAALCVTLLTIVELGPRGPEGSMREYQPG
jgi:hypothetical protein